MPRNPLLSSLAVLLLAIPAAAQEPIRFARTPDISPDGKLVAFSYQGDIWVVESIGGTARAVTSHPAHDLHPIFSPDGRQIAFASDRHGGYDVYTVSVRGGRPRRITFHESTDTPTDWSPDGKSILFASARDPGYPPDWQLYTVPAEGGRNHQITAAGGKEGVYSPAGDRIAYVRGPGAWYRKGYRGSSNDEVWVSRADGTDNRRLTAFEGKDDSPMWSPDGNTLYYVSETHGSPANLVRLPVSALDAPADKGMPPAGAPAPQRLTSHTEGVRKARLSRDGDWIVYECGADLWIVSTRSDSPPRKLAVQAFADDKTNPERVQTFTSGATEYALTADEKHLAFAVHGKLFLMEIGSKSKVTQLTRGPHNDHGIAWAPDASRILFLSDRSGHEDIYALEADDPAHPKFLEAHRFKVTALTSTPEAEAGLSYSPDGKLVAFIRAGKLLTMKPDGGDLKEVVAEGNVIDYDWSPDGRWLVYARQDPFFASELYIVPATGPTADSPIRNVTRYATLNVDVTWSADGGKLAFLSDRRGSGNLYTIDLRKPAVEGHKDGGLFGAGRVAIDWEDIHLRASPAGPMTATTAAVSPDGSQVAFRDEKTGDLWLASTSGSQITRLTNGGVRPGLIRWSKRKAGGGYLSLLYYLDGQGNVNLCRPSGGSGSATVAKVPFKIDLRIRTQETYQEMFDQSWRFLAENFYDAKFHGADWDAVREKYRPLVKQVAMKEDLYALMYLMMGELNASHLGVSGSTGSPEEATADLGLLYDEGYPGPGLKVREVLKRGPADLRGLDVRAGDIIVSIDDVELKPDTDVCRLLAGKVNEVVQVEVTADPKAGKRRHLEIKAASRGKVVSLMYDRWVENNAARVAELSKGKLGYIHIPSMDEEGLDKFVRRLYSDCFDKEAVVLDVRYNGGGFTHDRVLNYLGGKEHTFFRQRDGGEGLVLRASDRKWTKPMVVVINNRSYSDAEIFPSAFRTLGLGKLVGEPTGGMVIGTTAVRLVDGSMFRIPRTGVFTPRGVNMEREGVQPDVMVVPHPDELAKGEDVQLSSAVDVLQKEVIAWKKARGEGVAAGPEGAPPAGGAPMAPGGSK